MADRKVSVGLELQASGFKAEATAVEGKVESLDRKVDKLDRSITKIPPDAAKAAAAMKLLGDESSRAGGKLDEFGRRSTSLQQVDQRIIKTRGEVRALAEEFNRTGNVHVLERMFGADRELKGLTSLRKRLAQDLGDAGTEGGKEFSKNFSSTSQGILSTPGVGPIVAGAITAAVVAALPAINGALLSVAGLGGIGLGVAGQLHDPAVHKAFADMGNNLLDEFHRATTSFREPLIGTAHIFGDALSGALKSIDFGDLATNVAPLVSGLANMIKAIGPGLGKAFAAAGPILKALAADLPFIGKAISDMFANFARGGKGAQEGLRALVMILGGLIEAVGVVVLAASKLFEWFVAAGEAISHFEGKIAGAIPVLGHLAQIVEDFFRSFNSDNDIVVAARNLHGLGDAAQSASDRFAGLSSRINETFQTESVLAGQMVQKLFNVMMSVDQATLAWHQSLTALGDTMKQNGHTIDENTAKGQNNVQGIYAAVTANMAQYQAMVQAGVSATDAAAAYDANTAALERQLRQAGLTQAQIDSLIGKYKGVPDTVNTDIILYGIEDAINRLIELQRRLAGLPTSKEINVNYKTNYYSNVFGNPNAPTGQPHVNPGNRRWGGITQHAQDGLLSAGIYSAKSPARYAFAEPSTGGEAFVPRYGDYGRSMGILNGAAHWYGARVVPGGTTGGTVQHEHHIVIEGSGVLNGLRKEIRIRGGVVQEVMGT